MPKRKTAEVNVETAPSAEVKKKRSTPAATKPKTTAAATHKRSAIRTTEPLATTPAPAQAPIAATPTHEEVARLAYLYAEARGFVNGSPEDDWFRAERELLARR